MKIKLLPSQTIALGTALMAITEMRHDGDRISLLLSNVSVELICSQQMTVPYLREILISVTEREEEDGD